MSVFPFVTVILLGSGIGAICLSLLTVTEHWLFCPPSIFGDGQYAMVFMLTVPVGLFLGAITAMAMKELFADQYAVAGWICLVGAIPVLLFSVLFSALFAHGRPGVFKAFFDLLLFWFGISAPWAAALIFRGILFLRMPVA